MLLRSGLSAQTVLLQCSQAARCDEKKHTVEVANQQQKKNGYITNKTHNHTFIVHSLLLYFRLFVIQRQCGPLFEMLQVWLDFLYFGDTTIRTMYTVSRTTS